MPKAKYLTLLDAEKTLCKNHFESTGKDIRPRELELTGDIIIIFQSLIDKNGSVSISQIETFVNSLRTSYQQSWKLEWIQYLEENSADVKGTRLDDRIRKEVFNFFERVMARPKMLNYPSRDAMTWERLEEWVWRYIKTNPGVVNSRSP